MFFLRFLSVAIICCCSTDKRKGKRFQRPHSTQRTKKASLQQLISVSVNNGNETQSFTINSGATTAELYRKAEATGIIDPMNVEFLTQIIGNSQKFERRIIPDDPSIRLLAILESSSVANLVVPCGMILSVFAFEKVEITVRITNGDFTRSFKTKAGTLTSDVYQKAVDCGIMDNFYQFLLRCQHDEDHILILNTDPSTPPRTLVDYVNPRNPNELRLIVSPIPEGVLLFAMFRHMSPNQNIPSWDYARFCNQHHWHVLCASLSRRIEYEGNMSVVDVDESNVPTSRTQPDDWANSIHVVNVPSWTGTLHLEHIPPSVRSMKLKGKSVRVDFRSLKYSSLRELSLDFEKVIRFDILSLSGSSLEVLRLPSHRKLQPKEVIHDLGMLRMMRTLDKIRLKMLVFGGEKEQQIMWFAPELNDYDYIHIHR